jgi:hypothetical protein
VFAMPEPSHTGGHEQSCHELHWEGREKKEERAHLGGRREHDATVLGEMGEGARRGSSPRRRLQWHVDDKGATGARAGRLAWAPTSSGEIALARPQRGSEAQGQSG